MGATHQPIGQTAASCDWPEPMGSLSGRVQSLEAQPLPRELERAAFKVADFTVF